MIYWVLCQLEKDPGTVFYERDLSGRFGEAFGAAKQDGLVTQCGHPLSTGSPFYIQDKGKQLLAVPGADGRLEAFDPDDPETEALCVSARDFIQCTLCLDATAKKYREVNGLQGQPQSLEDRLYFLGSKLVNQRRVAVILGFFDRETTAVRYLRGLPNALVDAYDRYVVVCPTYQPAINVTRELSALRIEIVTLSQQDPWAILLPEEKTPRLPRGRRVILSHSDEEEFKTHGFRMRLPIHISGKMTRRNSTVVTLDGNEVLLPQADLRLLLRLVTALFSKDDGYLTWNEVKYSSEDTGELAIAPLGVDQAVGRLRDRFKSPLGGLKGAEFIERVRGKVRLSTHRKFITYDLDSLLAHPDYVIQSLAKMLPNSPEHNMVL